MKIPSRVKKVLIRLLSWEHPKISICDTVTERAFDGISGFEILAFGSLNNSYTIAGTKTIRLSGKVNQLVFQLLMRATHQVVMMTRWNLMHLNSRHVLI